jgi:hypothetical protein
MIVVHTHIEYRKIDNLAFLFLNFLFLRLESILLVVKD